MIYLIRGVKSESMAGKSQNRWYILRKMYRLSRWSMVLVLQHGQLVRAVQLKKLSRPSWAMATAYIQESHYLIRVNQSHLLKAIIFLWTYAGKEKHIRRFESSHMDRAGIFDCAFTVIACWRGISLEFIHLFTLPSINGLSLRRKIWYIAGYHHELTLGI